MFPILLSLLFLVPFSRTNEFFHCPTGSKHGDVAAGTVVKIDETGLYERFEKEDYDMQIACVRPNAIITRVKKQGCFSPMGYFVEANGTRVEGDLKFHCVIYPKYPEEKNRFIKFQKPMCEKNSDGTVANTKEQIIDKKFVFVCETNSIDNSTTLVLLRCLTPNGDEVPLGETKEENGKRYNCHADAELITSDDIAYNRRLTVLTLIIAIPIAIATYPLQVFVSYRLLTSKYTAPIYKLIVLSGSLGIIQFLIHIFVRNLPAFYEFSFIYKQIVDGGIPEWIIGYLIALSYTMRIQCVILIAFNRFLTFRFGSFRKLRNERVFRLSLISVIIPLLIAAFTPIFGDYYYVPCLIGDGKVVYILEMPMRNLMAVAPPMLYMVILAVSSYILNGYVIHRLIVLKKHTTLKSTRNYDSERGLAITSVATMLAQSLYMLSKKTMESSAFSIIPLTVNTAAPFWVLLATVPTVRKTLPKVHCFLINNRLGSSIHSPGSAPPVVQLTTFQHHPKMKPFKNTMVDDWIRAIKYFSNVTVAFDNLEPYSTFTCLPIGISTFILATYVYTTLLRNKNFKGKAYFHIFIAQGFIDLFAFLTNLIRYRLALFEAFGKFYASLGDSVWATVICVLALSLPRAQLVAQCLLTFNRLLAVSKPFQYDKWQATFSVCGLLALVIIPLIVAIPDILNGYYFGALYGVHGTIIFYSTARRSWPDMMKIADILATAFQFTLTLIAFVCNCVLIAIVFYLYFPPPLRSAYMFTTIALDAISIVPIWLLLAFSSAVRQAVRKTLPGGKTKAATIGGDRITILSML
uniref:Serpentine receptor class gamma n=1 Tax=Pristionchus pacificus TaxID=54126 RepID=A0A2A6BYJ4_PRIPA|eukprot:PDM70841.1 G protein-coupled receptor [Pristionchus pacificus]